MATPKAPTSGAKRQRDATSSTVDDLTVLHRARFAEWSPTAVVATAVTGDGSCVAAARESGAIDLWDSASWHCFLTIPGSKESAISCLAWVADPVDGSWRLFSGGLDSQLIEWDVQGRKPAAVAASLGGAIWAISPEPASSTEPGRAPRLAVACDDGITRLFAVEGGVPGAHYRKSLPTVEGRVLCVAWHPLGSVLLTGTSLGSIHAWDLGSNQETMCITTGDGSGEEACVWALRVLNDGTIVSGGSGGNVQFWDAAMGTLITGFRRHAADVLTLASAEPDQATKGDCWVFASGVDSQIASFKRLQDRRGVDSWVYEDSKRPHTHDVRTLTVIQAAGEQPLMLSAGNDAQLLVHRVAAFSREAPVRVCKCPEPLLACITPRFIPAPPAQKGKKGFQRSSKPPLVQPLLLTAQHSRIDLWQLGTTVSKDEQAASVSGYKWTEGAPVDVLIPPRHLAHIALSGTAHVMAASVSSDGTLIAYSDVERGTRLIEMAAPATGTDTQEAPSPSGKPHGSLKPCRGMKPLPPAVELGFVGRDRLALLQGGGALVIADTSSGEVVAKFTELEVREGTAGGQILGKPGDRNPRVPAAETLSAAASQLCVSPKGQCAAIANSGSIHLYNLETLLHHGQLPPASEEGSPITAIAFSPDGSRLAAATADNGVMLYDVPLCRVAQWSQDNAELPARLRRMPGTIVRISFNPSPELNSALMHTASGLCHISFDKPAGGGSVAASGGRKRQRRGDTSPPGSNCRILALDNPCLFCGFSSPNAALLVEKSWSEVAGTFPPPLYRHRYGT